MTDESWEEVYSEMDGSHLGYNVKYIILKWNKQLGQAWFVEKNRVPLVLLKQMGNS